MKTTVACLLCVLAAGVSGCGRETPPAAQSAPAPSAAPSVAATPAAGTGTPAPAPLPADLARIVDAYRKIIVLLEEGRTLDTADQRRADVAGRLIYQQKHDQLSALTRDLTDDVRARPPRLDRV